MKFLFLDIDGVLNSKDWYTYYWTNNLKYTNPNVIYLIDYRTIEFLNDIIDKTGCEIIISSSWRREYKKICNKLYKSGLKKGSIIGKIEGEETFDIPRGKLIDDYLKKHKCDNYCIIDDDKDMLDNQLLHFVHINNETGLTLQNKDKIIKILNNI